MTLRIQLLGAARDAFLLACAGVIGLLILVIVAEGGPLVGAAIAGLPLGDAPAETMRLAAGFDFLIPVGYCAGFILLIAALGKDSSHLVLGAILLTAIGTSCDLMENGMMLMANGAVASGVSVTLAKYGTLTVVGFLLTVLLTPDTTTTVLAKVLFRVVTPITLATNIMGLNGSLAPWLLLPSLLFIFGFLAWVAHQERDHLTAQQ